MPLRSWEEPGSDDEGGRRPPHDERDWESASSGDECNSDSDLEGGEPSPQDEFLQFVLMLYMTRVINAMQLSVLMWWAGKAGIPSVAPYGFRPNAPSGYPPTHHLFSTTNH